MQHAAMCVPAQSMCVRLLEHMPPVPGGLVTNPPKQAPVSEHSIWGRRASTHRLSSLAIQPLPGRLQGRRDRQHVGQGAVDAPLELQKVAVHGSQRQRLGLGGLSRETAVR